MTHPLSLTTHYLQMIPYGSEAVMATGTGFIYEYNSISYLITNGHNVTRLNPDTNERITATAAFPVEIHTTVRTKHPAFIDRLYNAKITLKLYLDEDYTMPMWFVHPKYGYSVDVIAISLAGLDKVLANLSLSPINKLPHDEFELNVSDEVFVLGYPLDINSGFGLPIWKRGSIASEPSLGFENMPKVLIDTATRSGMSGSPVIARQYQFDEEALGINTKFMGVYSGRLGAKNALEAQLGIVWKGEVIEEIIRGQVVGNIDFQKM